MISCPHRIADRLVNKAKGPATLIPWPLATFFTQRAMRLSFHRGRAGRTRSVII